MISHDPRFQMISGIYGYHSTLLRYRSHRYRGTPISQHHNSDIGVPVLRYWLRYRRCCDIGGMTSDIGVLYIRYRSQYRMWYRDSWYHSWIYPISEVPLSYKLWYQHPWYHIIFDIIARQPRRPWQGPAHADAWGWPLPVLWILELAASAWPQRLPQ